MRIILNELFKCKKYFIEIFVISNITYVTFVIITYICLREKTRFKKKKGKHTLMIDFDFCS